MTPAILLLAAALAGPQPHVITGTLSACHDGDTCAVMTDAGERVSVRLKAVAAPEVWKFGNPPEPGGIAARDWLRARFVGHSATCHLTGVRNHDRWVGTCFVEGEDIGAAVIGAGLARPCPAFGHEYDALERPQAARLTLPPYCEVAGE